ncbi:hypothetical protein HK100_012119 [Physocladia obscura]|uniref:Uncharacterized protein n=1 Tax=Physocladia obscura TaxID=109957 RepID=A0AAD5XG54_9FUNG|nr:hypothetical protein HK100_012119 [Physocladia obscura]
MRSLRSRNFEAAAEAIALLALGGDKDALWVLANNPADSPISDPYFRFCAALCIRSILFNFDSAILWHKLAADGFIADACIQLAEIYWHPTDSHTSTRIESDYGMALTYLLKAVAILDLGHGRGGTFSDSVYKTKVRRANVCLQISECFAYGIGANVNEKKALEWLEKGWYSVTEAKSSAFLSSMIFGEQKGKDEKVCAWELGVWYATGKPPAEPRGLERELVQVAAGNKTRAYRFPIDEVKGQTWMARSL